MQKIGFKIVFNIILTLLSQSLLYAQGEDVILNDTLQGSVVEKDSVGERMFSIADSLFSDTEIVNFSDSLSVVSDTLLTDSVVKKNNSGIEDLVDYDAVDSLVYSRDGSVVELYNEGIITYGDIKLEAGYIRYNMDLSEVTAYGIPDSTGKIVQKPIFSEKEDSYEVDSMRYNFKSRRAYIRHVITEQEGGFLHSSETKMQNNGHIHIKDGKFTTCDAEHPHFYIAITKGISVPGDKIIAGPAYLVIEDVPLPIGLPFGFFPNSRKQTSGLIIPQYGEEQNRGFYLRDGGYYFSLNDYFDLRVTGDIYSNGTWGAKVGSNYKKRYKFNGSVSLQFFNSATGYRGMDDYSKSKDYSIAWSHGQAREASPNSTFRASVNMSSSSYDKLHTGQTNINSVVTNTKQSSVSYTKSWPGSPFNLSASLNHSQNSNTGVVNMTLPKVSFNMGRINPFERKKRVGPKKWYEDIQLSYSSLLENRVKTTDSTIFTNQVWNDMTNGFRHEVPLSLNIKPFKKVAALQSLTITPNVSYKGMIYTGYTEKLIDYEEEEVDGQIEYNPVVTDSLHTQLSYAHAYLPRVSAGLSPKLYGMYNFTGGGRLEAIRHVITPSASFSYVPDMTAIQPNYYRELWDTINNELLDTYSIYEDQMYGTPTFNGASGSMSLSLRNNLEAKIRSKNDSIDEVEKVKLIDNFNMSTSYNFFNKDSLAPSWSTISMSGSTRLFNNNLSVSFRGTMDPFGYSDTRNRVNETYFSQTGKLARLTAASVNLGTSFSSKKAEGKDSEKENKDPLLNTAFDDSGLMDPNMANNPMLDDDLSGYTDFSMKWSLKLDYSFSYKKAKEVSSIVQTVRVSGQLGLTPKWSTNFSSGYDVFNKQFTTTSISLSRDLHCWEMRVTVIPFGTYKSYNFQINAKSSILSDLKYNKRKRWTDNF